MSSDGPLDLLGDWSLQRRAFDRNSGVRYAMTGRLTVAGDGDLVRWHEAGELRWSTGRVAVSRDYRIVPSSHGWQVCFADGRPFHPWAPGAAVEHLCRDDRYRGLLAVDRGATRLRTWWDVVGPMKDQRIVTRCARGCGTTEP